MNYLVENRTVNMSEFYSGVYIPAAKQEAEKPRRRRKKNKGESSDGVFKKRKLSEEQVHILELNFESEHKLESERKDRLASELGLDPRQVAVWFQNRRAKWKSQKIEEEYSKLKTEHESTVVEKCRLEIEVSKLKEQLLDADKEIQRLGERSDGVSSNSPGSSFSMETLGPLFLGDFGMEGINNIYYEPENYTAHTMNNWVDMFM